MVVPAKQFSAGVPALRDQARAYGDSGDVPKFRAPAT
jgi:hypothetical protein